MREIASQFAAPRPFDNCAAFIRCEASVISELSKRRMRKPRRHALLFDNLGNAAGSSRDFFIARQRERSFGPRSVTLHAMLVKERRDVFGVGHRSVGLLLSWKRDGTAIHGSFPHSHFASS